MVGTGKIVSFPPMESVATISNSLPAKSREPPFRPSRYVVTAEAAATMAAADMHVAMSLSILGPPGILFRLMFC